MPSGIACLEAYHTEQDASSGIIKEMPVHDESSHGASALRTFAEAHSRGMLEGTSKVAGESRKHEKREATTGLRSSHGLRSGSSPQRTARTR